MSVDVCSVQNEAEAEAIRQLLQDHEIEARVVRLESSASRGASSPQNWGVVRVRDEDLERARGLVDEWERARPGGNEDEENEEEEKAAMGPQVWRAGPRNESREHVLGVWRKAWPIIRTVVLVG